MLVTCLSGVLTSLAEAQVIHRDSVANFYGVVAVTATQKPSGWDRDRHYEPSLISDAFAAYYTGVTRDAKGEILMRHKPARYDTTHEEVVWIGPWDAEESVLDVPERDLVITSLHNGGYEASRNVLAFWRMNGDSLHFLRLHRKIYAHGLGHVGIGSEYVLGEDASIYFVLEAGGGDAGLAYFSDTLVRLHSDFRLDELFQWRYGTDTHREDQTRASYTFTETPGGTALQVVEERFKWHYHPERADEVTNTVFVGTDTTMIHLEGISDSE